MNDRYIKDEDIALCFGTTTSNLNKAKNRNLARFPEHFAFTLTNEEVSMFQSGISMQTKLSSLFHTSKNM